jgi:hypothetical protein
MDLVSFFIPFFFSARYDGNIRFQIQIGIRLVNAYGQSDGLQDTEYLYKFDDIHTWSSPQPQIRMTRRAIEAAAHEVPPGANSIFWVGN